MRKIKFRAWDIKNKRMNYGGFWVGALTGQIAMVVGERSGRPVIEIQDKEDFILEQYTGLKDKNGKEIYEGDKVRIMTHWGQDYEQDKYKVGIVTNGCRCGLNTNGMVSIQREGQKEYEPQLEIIGNIHDKEQENANS